MSPELLNTDVLIVGKGVSGLILQLLLEKKGIHSILIDKVNSKQNLPLAETIPPSTLEILDKIDLLSVFEAFSTKTYGYQSKWNSSQISDENFFSKGKFSNGLKINKQKIITALAEKSKHIIQIKDISEISIKDSNNSLSVKGLNNKLATINCNLIIDATGRKRHILKQANIDNIEYDKNLAYLCYLPKTGPELKYGFFTESFSNAWGTISDLNETTRIVSLYTTKENKLYTDFKDYKKWNTLLNETSFLKYCMPTKGNFKVFGKQANSSIPSQIVFQNVLSIGDAAMAFNPISSHGISNAIYTAKEAATTIEKHLNGNDKSLKVYEEKMYTIFNEYIRYKEKLFQLH
ncbi:FAD-dependent monooxygenase [uncultured Tenacibaculum sp.]|uniref:NAD(P)/FAD-dependent oxidoreductase n=1 Tax=uncultured Tenacibaculum sp. TaxID=174713 RepID=UPI002628230B|nr:FAD-dependent monooxygenase [uncultured Tenacibaculum sp.]